MDSVNLLEDPQTQRLSNGPDNASNLWFSKPFTRFECSKYTKDRIVAIRKGKSWFRGMYASNSHHIEYLNNMFGPGSKYDMYVSGFTFNWESFRTDTGELPSSSDFKGYREWVKENMTPDDLMLYVNKKDLVFEIDRKKNVELPVAGFYALKIIDYLKAENMPYHVIFSGNNGYHVVVEDAERYLDKFEVQQFGRSLKALAHTGFEIVGMILDDIFEGKPFVDQYKKGRDYEDVEIHFSPMYDQGVRKAPYSLTHYGMVALPVGEKELAEVKDVSYYKPRQVLRNYKIVGRGWI